MASLARLTALFTQAERTLPALLRREAARTPDRMLFEAGGTAWTVEQCLSIAGRAASMLAAAGVRAGDPVALICGNRVEFMQVFLGAAWLGAVVVPINTAARGAQLRHVLSDCAARLLIIEVEHCAKLEAVDLATLPIEHVWVIGGDLPPDLPCPSSPLPALPDQAAPSGDIRPETTIAVLYTSGTTGPSKGVCCPHAQYFWWGAITGDLLGLRPGDVLLSTLPLFHTNALNAFFQALLHEASLVVEPRFSASGFATALAVHGATVTYVLGAMVPILLSRPAAAQDRAHRVRVALAPGVPGHLHAPFTERFGIGLVDGFGSTETNFVIGTTLDRQVPGWMGPVYPGFAARVLDASGRDAPDGEAGELALRAEEPLAFATGYLGLPEVTRAAWREGWFHTGDRVVRRADGYVRFVDRLKDSIRRRGENVSSFEVEQVLLSHPAIATAAAFPVRSELAEDEIMAAIVLRPEHRLSPEALIAFCAPRLAYFAIPRFIEFVPELPVTANGKIEKFKLREQGITPGTWDRDAAQIGSRAEMDYAGVAITGCAEIPYQRRRPGGSTLRLLADAFRRAIAHAGVTHAEVDGLAVASFTLPPDHAIDVAWQLGLSLRWCMDDALGGASGVDMLQHAARAIQAGDATTIVILAADHFDTGDFRTLVDTYNRTTRDHMTPMGVGGPNALFALVTQAYAAAHALDRADFAGVCIAQRDWARRNPDAVYRSALTLADYLESPFVAEPLCRYDCVPVVSGADAVVVQASRDGIGIVALGAWHNGDHQAGEGWRTGLAQLAPGLWRDSGIGPDGMDVVSVYDDYPVMVLSQLHELGVADADMQRFVADRLPTLAVNTSGGQLSAGQAGAAGGLHGLVEAIVQLRGEAGARQVARARHAVVAGYGMVQYRYGMCANAVVLSDGRA